MLKREIGDFDHVCDMDDFRHKNYQKLIESGIFMAKIVIRIFDINKSFHI